MSTRKLTDEQFADGTSSDGNRLERGLDDVVRRINAVRKGDLARRFVPTQYVFGYLPDLSLATVLPFMLDVNDAGALAAGTTAPEEYQNPRRLKGDYLQDDNDVNWIWTTSFRFHRPVILVDVLALLTTDTAFINDFTYGPGAPPVGKSISDPADDIRLILAVDDPWRSEDRRYDAVEIARTRWSALAETFTGRTPAGGWADMTPTPHPGGALAGLAIHARDLEIPIRRDARCRLSLELPHWAADLDPWGVQPMHRQYYSVTVTVLEEAQS